MPPSEIGCPIARLYSQSGCPEHDPLLHWLCRGSSALFISATATQHSKFLVRSPYIGIPHLPARVQSVAYGICTPYIEAWSHNHLLHSSGLPHGAHSRPQHDITNSRHPDNHAHPIILYRTPRSTSQFLISTAGVAPPPTDPSSHRPLLARQEPYTSPSDV